jgi:putative nucleotidyltransferase with HDIG domain
MNSIVPSGSFRVLKSENASLLAYLGTCVGVVIVDRKAGIGGLYHVLLPETASGIENPEDDAYARTGMPKFLKALMDAGCRPEHMEATLAGGALIGRITHLDLNLDIGGRILEIVQRMLADASIKIKNSECGGCYGRHLTLNCRTLVCRIEPSTPSGSVELKPVKQLTSAELDQAIARIKPIPQVVLTIMRMIRSNDYSAKEIAREMQKDQVISAKVINICNSAFVSPSREIQSVNQALVMLGERFVSHIILSLYLGSFLHGYNQGYSMSLGGLYHHSISTAVIAERIARLTKTIDPDLAYLAGLTHDIGKVVLDQYVGPARPHFYRKMNMGSMDLLTAEKTILGFTHCEAGTRLAELWSLPSFLVDTIAHHGKPENAQNDPTLTYAIHLANLLNVRFCVGAALEGIGIEDMEGCLDHLGISSDSLQWLISKFSGEHGVAPGDPFGPEA